MSKIQEEHEFAIAVYLERDIQEFKYENTRLKDTIEELKARDTKLFEDVTKHFIYLWQVRDIDTKHLEDVSYKIRGRSLKSLLKVLKLVTDFKEERNGKTTKTSVG